MRSASNLSPADREFFQLVSRALFLNPFGDERAEIDREIAGRVGGGSEREVLERVIGKITEKVQALERDGRARLELYRDEPGEVMRNVLRFEVFYRFRHEFMDLIRAQLAAGDSPVSVPFGREAVGIFVHRGFSEEEAIHYLALGYQAWRAYYFIHRGLVGASPSMRKFRFDLWNNVFSQSLEWYSGFLWQRMEEFSTLLLGETGTGKGTAAAAIGQSGFIPYDARRRRFEESFVRNFVPINLSQFPESLIESELFGHRKGAFTGAVEHHEGVFSRCTPHGSIFLDEIGDLSVPVQTKLLQVLQERTFSKVGSHEKLRFRGRAIAATNQPLDELRHSGQFRDDLYYRLCSTTIVLPTLRQRFREDPLELDRQLAHTVTRMTGEERPQVVERIKEILFRDLGEDYPWPGNVRELEQAVRSALLISTYPGDTGLGEPGILARLMGGIDQGDISVDALVAAYCALLYERHGTYEEVARRTALDWRTVKKHVSKVHETLPNAGWAQGLSLVKRALFRR